MNYIVALSKPWNINNDELFNSSKQNKFFYVYTHNQLEALLQEQLDIRYIFFLHWNWKVPEGIFKKYECVCFHMTNVPYGRGGSPLQNLIVRGYKETTLTALRMVEQLDAGPVYAKRPLSLSGTAHEIYLRATELCFEVIDWIINNEPQPENQQGEVVVFKRRKPEQSRLPSAGTITELFDHIRMLDAPTYPLAFLEHGNFILEFSSAEIFDKEIFATVRIRNTN